MKKEICFSDLALLTHEVERNVDRLLEHGADKIELLMDGIEWNEMDDQIRKMKSALRGFRVGFTVHPPAWDTNLTSENQAIRKASFEEYKKAVEFAHEIEAEHVVIHPGFAFSPVFDKAMARKRAEQAIGMLCRVAGPLGVKLAVENVGYKGASIYTEDEYVTCLENIDATAGYLIDTGHAHLNNWDVSRMIRRTGARLNSVHLHDNSSQGDEHLPIETGTLQWAPIYEALKEVDASCQLILEYAPGTDLNQLTMGKQLLGQRLGF